MSDGDALIKAAGDIRAAHPEVAEAVRAALDERPDVAPAPVVAMGDGVELPVARAPWTPDQVASLSHFQAASGFHPYTCGNDACPGIDRDDERMPLVAEADGWHCPACDYRQDWALSWVADGSWRDWTGIEVRVDGGEPVRASPGFVPDEFLRAALGPGRDQPGPPHIHVLRPPENEKEMAADPFLPSLTITRESGPTWAPSAGNDGTTLPA